MSSGFFFLYQRKGGEEDWVLELADQREQIIKTLKPAFVTVLDLTSIPDDHDWSKTKYRGPWYVDFDADGDLELACSQFKAFLGKLDSEFGFDLTQARLFASGGKGFHIEIPAECFVPKVATGGYVWLPYIYRAMADAVVVDTMDMRVYSGKRGRMWRTPGVQRENGNYKIALSLADALEITPETYAELVKHPHNFEDATPPSCNSKLAMLFERSRNKVVSHMRGRKKRLEKANAFLDPWRKSGRTPGTIEKLMSGEIVADGVGFNRIAMQLAIYATGVGMALETFLEKCKGLCESYVGDSDRYGTVSKRREQLADQYRYMDDNAMYEFDAAPIIKLVKPGTSVSDLGVMDQEDHEDAPAKPRISEDDEDLPHGEVSTEEKKEDEQKGVRRGFFLNAQGMWRRTGDIFEPVCRATIRNVEAYLDAEKREFRGYEFDLVTQGRRPNRAMLAGVDFTSVATLKKFFAAHQLSFQGTDADAIGLLDVMAEKAQRSKNVSYAFPCEGMFVLEHPEDGDCPPVVCYLTQDLYMSSIHEGESNYFKLKYKPTQAISSYLIDIHNAPHLEEKHRQAIRDLLTFTKPEIAADLLGWFVACYYRSLYLKLFNQFPLLQVYGDAGAGKSQTVWLLAHLHWYRNTVSVKSALSCTPFAMDSHASTSTSAPFILDEYKPRELSKIRGRMEKIKDVLKMSYIGGDIGERGTINRGAENSLAVIRSRCTAPIVFIGESIEMETAIVERSVCVPLSQSYQTKARTEAFQRIHSDTEAISALGKEFVELGFSINLERMRQEFNAVHDEVEASQPGWDEVGRKRLAPRMIYNRAVIIHGLRTLKHVLSRTFDGEFDKLIDQMVAFKLDDRETEESKVISAFGMSEASKVLNRMALMSRDRDAPWQITNGKDYIVGDGWLEIKVERAYDCYRRFCHSLGDTALFDSLDSFLFAMNTYGPATDRRCAGSDLRAEDPSAKVVRFDLSKLNTEGVSQFRE